jgi:phosphohistidine phosphatase SixA
MHASRRRWLAGTASLIALALAAPAPQVARAQDEPGSAYAKLLYPKTIVVVRHAEKSGEPQDPSLSEEGAVRAQELARLLGHAGVTHLLASEFNRTRETLEPLQQALILGGSEIPIQVVSALDPKAMISALRELPRGSVAVAAGHSNTVPTLVDALAGLSGERRTLMTEADYDRVFVITLCAEDRAALLELRYGD